MKTKIFLAFIIVIFAALLSNFIFGWLIIKDFDSYVKGVREEQFFWVVASAESSYSNGQWDTRALSESIHWAMMLGFNTKILDREGNEVISAKEVIKHLPDAMKWRMQGLLHIPDTAAKPYEKHPLYVKGQRVGTLLSRQFHKEIIMEKEIIFKQRTKNFLLISLFIAGIGSLVLAIVLSRHLTKPIANLKIGAEKIAKGDFNVKIVPASKDEIGKLSESFNKMAESLRKEEELRKHLMSNIAHELRTPLTIAKTHIEAIEDGIIDTGIGIDNVKTEINRLIRLIKGIEDVTAAEASFFIKTVETEINLREFLADFTEKMHPVFKEKGLYLTVKSKDDLFVVTDIDKLEKILLNIISNSLKFTQKGGVTVDYGIKEMTFFVEIKDSGVGIPENEIPFIFNRFYRIKKQPPLDKNGEAESGFGLGLAIVKELINAMNGKIEVESKVNEGTAFRIYLPYNS